MGLGDMHSCHGVVEATTPDCPQLGTQVWASLGRLVSLQAVSKPPFAGPEAALRMVFALLWTWASATCTPVVAYDAAHCQTACSRAL